MIKIDKIKVILFVLTGCLAFLLLFFSYSRVFDEFEYSTLDLRFRLRPPKLVNKDIVIIEIADDSIEKVGKWPFPRNYHALLTKALASAGVKTIIFDVIFCEGTEHDEVFAETVKGAGNVYMPYVFDLRWEDLRRSCEYTSEFSTPLIIEFREAVKGMGFINAVVDIDGKIRRILPFVDHEKTLYPHLTVLAALHNLGYSFNEVEIIPGNKIVVGGELSIPVDNNSFLLVDYPNTWGNAFRHYSYFDIIQSYLAGETGQEPIIDLNELRDTICFIGITATGASDAHPSPLEPLYPGVGVHASVYNSIINDSFLIRLNRWWNLFILILMSVLTAIITAKSRKRFALLSIFLIMMLYGVIALLVFWLFGIWIDVFYPLVVMAIIYIIFTFKKYIAEIQRREILERELNIAKNIQQSFLPKEIPKVSTLEVCAEMLTARQVGGDLYDVVKLSDDKLGVMIGDVSGKGVPAALFMASVVSVFKTFVKTGSASAVLKSLNNQLMGESTSGLFVTLTYMIFDTKEKSIEMSIGGHMPTLIVSPAGKVELAGVEKGMPLGLMDSDFSEVKKKYEPGSIFVLYSDGVTEAMNTSQEMFGEERLVELAGSLKGASATDMVAAIHDAVARFAGRAKQHDDITVLAVKT